MPLKMLVLAIAAVAATLPGPATPANDVVDLTKSFSKALGLKLTEIKTLSGPTRSEREQVAELTGTSARDLDRAEYWSSSIPHPRDQSAIAVTLCRVPVKVGSGLVLCVDYSGVMVNAAILGLEEEETAKYWGQFLSQCVGRKVPNPSRAKSTSALEKMSKNEGLTGGLVRVRKLMLGKINAIQKIGRMLEHGEKIPKEYFKKARKASAELVRLDQPLKSFLGGAAPEFARTAKELAEALKALEKLPLGKDDAHDAAKDILGSISTSCKSCHGIKHDDFHGPLRKALADRRHRAGYGDGFFLVGYDYYPGGEDHGRDQMVASSLRRASLLVAQIQN